MRVALVVTDLQPGGTPIRLARLARRLRDAGIEVHVGCLAPPGPLSEVLKGAGIPTFSADATTSRDFAAVWRLSKCIRKIDPDLIHATLTHANVASRWIGRKLRIPVVTSTATIEIERPWHARLERWTSGWDAGHIVNSASIADHVHQKFGVPRERIFLVPPSIEPFPLKLDRLESRRQLALPLQARIVLWAGRFDPVKRVNFLIESVSGLPQDSVLALAGDGALRAQLEELVSARGLQSRVKFLGWQGDLSAAMSAADVFAFPSRTEGMPNAVLLAMAAGLPVIASDIAPHRELSGAEERLMLVTDSPPAWTGAIANLLGNPENREQMSQKTRDWAHVNLDPARTAAAMIEIYKRVMSGVIGSPGS